MTDTFTEVAQYIYGHEITPDGLIFEFGKYSPIPNYIEDWRIEEIKSLMSRSGYRGRSYVKDRDWRHYYIFESDNSRGEAADQSYGMAVIMAALMAVKSE